MAKTKAKAKSAISHRKLQAVRAETPPVIDGVLNDDAWQTAGVADYFSDRFTRSTEIDQTKVYVCYDDEFIYFGFECEDSQPEGIVGREIVPDARFRGEDSVMIALDPFRTRQGDDASYYLVNPRGTGSAYPAGGRANKREWKGDWKSAAQRTDTGWTAEAAIPWEVINYPNSRGMVVWGLNFQRHQERTKIVSQWSNLGPDRRRELGGDWVELQVPRKQFKTRLSLLPYTLPGYRGVKGTDFHSGLDARMALSPELTAVGTINPDFSTVERTIAGVNFVRGERFVADTRPFFLEGGDIFDLNVGRNGAWGRAFFSGRVPQFDTGAKIYGRLGQNTVGLMTTFDIGNRVDAVGHLLHPVGPESFVGAYFVERYVPGDANTVLGVQEDIRTGSWRLRSELTSSLGRKAGGNALYTSAQWRNQNWRAQFGYTRVDADFRAASGFVPFRNFHGPHFWTEYETKWREGPLRELEIDLRTSYDVRTNGDFFRNLWDLDAEVQTRSDWGLRAGWTVGRFRNEKDNEFRLGVTRNLSNRFDRASFDVSFGKRADRSILFLRPGISKRILGSWDVSAQASILMFQPNAGQYIFNVSREIDEHRALGFRIIIEDRFNRFNRREFRGVHYVFTYKVSGGTGRETFLLLGDPLTAGRRTRTHFLYKVIWPM